MSGAHGRMTASSAVLAAGAAAADVVAEKAESLDVRFLDERQVRLAEQLTAQVHDEVARALDVHRALHHGHQRFAQRNEIRRDVRVIFADRPGVDAGHEEAGHLVVLQDALADEGQIEIARAGTVGIERRAVFPAKTRDRAAAQDNARVLGDVRP